MSNKPIPYKLYLPLWNKVIFIDWFGVLSTDLFWHTILENERHPYHETIKKISEKLFKDDSEKVQKWMRGQMSALEVLETLDTQLKLDNRAKNNFLIRRLFEDCRKIRFRRYFLESIRQMAKSTCVIIATDNMDCFTEQTQFIPKLSQLSDDVLSSSNLGVLKTDSVKDFFNPWLLDHKLNFNKALLIDDNKKTCEKFESCGGSAILFREVDETLQRTKQWLNHEHVFKSKNASQT